jgi:hypothetical protein
LPKLDHQLPVLGLLVAGQARADTLVTVAWVSQFARHDSEIPKSAAMFLDPHTRLAVADDLLPELPGIEPRHDAHPSSSTSRHHRSDVTGPRGSPET